MPKRKSKGVQFDRAFIVIYCFLPKIKLYLQGYQYRVTI